jgi:uncharacterized protein|uniref:ATP-dependent sacrificial sulfur transferase LarE n=1 Tax=candidate division WOR-3 bacterium TaxID=2052148 RepID=A0A7V3RFY3_UNCW3
MKKNSALAKFEKLKRILKRYPGVVVAFSGGVDSTLLLKVAKDVLKDNVIAVTASSPLYPQSEINNAKKIARLLKVRHKIIHSRELENKAFKNNPRNRCYYCKIEMFKNLKKIAERDGYEVIEASNYSDLGDFRPGLRAVNELDIHSPLIEAGLKKDEIRELAKYLKLPNWAKPSMACLASRIPYGVKIDEKILRRIEESEAVLKDSGFIQCRVRDHFPIARIEIIPDDFEKLLKKRDKIIKSLKKIGYKYISLDLEGYRTGSMNL